MINQNSRLKKTKIRKKKIFKSNEIWEKLKNEDIKIVDVDRWSILRGGKLTIIVNIKLGIIEFDKMNQYDKQNLKNEIKTQLVILSSSHPYSKEIENKISKIDIIPNGQSGGQKKTKKNLLGGSLTECIARIYFKDDVDESSLSGIIEIINNQISNSGFKISYKKSLSESSEDSMKEFKIIVSDSIKIEKINQENDLKCENLTRLFCEKKGGISCVWDENETSESKCKSKCPQYTQEECLNDEYCSYNPQEKLCSPEKYDKEKGKGIKCDPQNIDNSKCRKVLGVETEENKALKINPNNTLNNLKNKTEEIKQDELKTKILNKEKQIESENDVIKNEDDNTNSKKQCVPISEESADSNFCKEIAGPEGCNVEMFQKKCRWSNEVAESGSGSFSKKKNKILLNKTDIGFGSGSKLNLINGTGSGSKTIKNLDKIYKINNGTGSHLITEKKNGTGIGSEEYINLKKGNINTKKGTGMSIDRMNGTGSILSDKKLLIKDSKIGDNIIFTASKINFKKGSVIMIDNSEYNKIKAIDQTKNEKEFKITLVLELKNNYKRGTSVSVLDGKSISKITKKIKCSGLNNDLICIFKKSNNLKANCLEIERFEKINCDPKNNSSLQKELGKNIAKSSWGVCEDKCPSISNKINNDTGSGSKNIEIYSEKDIGSKNDSGTHLINKKTIETVYNGSGTAFFSDTQLKSKKNDMGSRLEPVLKTKKGTGSGSSKEPVLKTKKGTGSGSRLEPVLKTKKGTGSGSRLEPVLKTKKGTGSGSSKETVLKTKKGIGSGSVIKDLKIIEDKGSGSKLDKGSVSKMDNGSGSKLDKGSVSKMDNGSGSKLDKGSVSKMDNGSGSKLDKGSVSKLDKGSGSKLDKGSVSKMDNGSGSKLDKGSVSKMDNGSGSKLDKGSVSKMDNGSGSKLDIGSGSKLDIGSVSKLGSGSGSKLDIGSGSKLDIGSVSKLGSGSGSKLDIGSGSKLGSGSGSKLDIGSGSKLGSGSGSKLDIGSGSKLGSGSGSKLGSGSGSKLDIGSGSKLGSGSGSKLDIGSGSKLGSGSGSKLGSGSGSKWGSGSGSKLGSGSGSKLGSGSGSKWCSGSGSKLGSGSGSKWCSGSGSKLGSGSGSKLGSGSGSKWCSGSGSKLGSGSGSKWCSGSGSKLGSGSGSKWGSGSGSKLGSGSGSKWGSGSGSKLGSGSGSKLGSGSGSKLGSGSGSKLGSGSGSKDNLCGDNPTPGCLWFLKNDLPMLAKWLSKSFEFKFGRGLDLARLEPFVKDDFLKDKGSLRFTDKNDQDNALKEWDKYMIKILCKKSKGELCEYFITNELPILAEYISKFDEVKTLDSMKTQIKKSHFLKDDNGIGPRFTILLKQKEAEKEWEKYEELANIPEEKNDSENFIGKKCIPNKIWVDDQEWLSKDCEDFPLNKCENDLGEFEGTNKPYCILVDEDNKDSSKNSGSNNVIRNNLKNNTSSGSVKNALLELDLNEIENNLKNNTSSGSVKNALLELDLNEIEPNNSNTSSGSVKNEIETNNSNTSSGSVKNEIETNNSNTSSGSVKNEIETNNSNNSNTSNGSVKNTTKDKNNGLNKINSGTGEITNLNGSNLEEINTTNNGSGSGTYEIKESELTKPVAAGATEIELPKNSEITSGEEVVIGAGTPKKEYNRVKSLIEKFNKMRGGGNSIELETPLKNEHPPGTKISTVPPNQSPMVELIFDNIDAKDFDKKTIKSSIKKAIDRLEDSPLKSSSIKGLIQVPEDKDSDNGTKSEDDGTKSNDEETKELTTEERCKNETDNHACKWFIDQDLPVMADWVMKKHKKASRKALNNKTKNNAKKTNKSNSKSSLDNKKKEEDKKKAEEEKKKLEEEKKKALDNKSKAEEARKKAEEARKKAEEEKKKAEEEKKKAEEARKKAEEEKKKAEEEKKKAEEEKKKAEEEKKKAEEEKKKAEEKKKVQPVLEIDL